MDTKLKSDIAESDVLTELLRRGFSVLKPVGDRLPYDLAIDLEGRLVRIQIKSAWKRGGVYIVDVRRTRTNRRRMRRARYTAGDFDFAVLCILDKRVFYVMPIEVFRSYQSEMTLAESWSRQRKPRSYAYREAWHLLNG